PATCPGSRSWLTDRHGVRTITMLMRGRWPSDVLMEVLMTRRRLAKMKIQTDWHKSVKGCWSMTLGWRCCRVRVTQREPGGVFYGITLVSGRGHDWKSFGNTSRSEAQQHGDAFVQALLETDATATAHPLTLGELW